MAAPRVKKAKQQVSSPPTSPAASVAKTGTDVSNSFKPEQGKASVKTDQSEAPLIKFDSPESEQVVLDNFDPLFSNVSSVNSAGTADGNKSLRDRGEPVINSVKVEVTSSEQQELEKDLGNDLFDPLSGVGNLSLSNKTPVSRYASHSVRNDPLSSHSPRRDSSDLLMHEWSLASLARSHGMPKVAQPLRMSYPNNPFLSGRSQNQSPLRGAPLHNQGQMAMSQGKLHQQGLNLGHKVSDFHKVNQLRLQQPFRGSRSPSPTPGHLSAASYAPYSHPQPSMTAHIPGVISFPPPLQPPLIHGQCPSSDMTTLTSSGSQHQTDLFSDLLDIDFGGQTSQVPSQDAQKQQLTSSVSAPSPSQSKWETFD